jgi:hypothetical protein
VWGWPPMAWIMRRMFGLGKCGLSEACEMGGIANNLVAV